MNGMYTGNISKIRFYLYYFRMHFSKILKTEHASHVKPSVGNNGRDFYENKKFKEYILSDLARNRTFSEIMNTIIKCNDLNKATFEDRTKLYENSFHQVTKPNTVHSFHKIITICVGLNLNLDISLLLLGSMGYAFAPTNELHQAYKYLIEMYRKDTIEECNKILETLGFADSLLGSMNYKERKSK